MAKVTVTKEVAEAFESAKREYTDEQIVEIAITKTYVEEREPLNDINPYRIAKMLLQGYEVEKSPEEILRAHYLDYQSDNKFFADEYDRGYHGGYLCGIEDTLKILGISIERVTDQ